MVGIYKDEFIDFLKKNLAPIKTTPKNIICKCPWCEYDKKVGHFHLHISLDIPIFNCFHATCPGKGTIKKLIKKVEGLDKSIDRFVDLDLVNKNKIENKHIEVKIKKLKFPEIKESDFKEKVNYLRNRLKYVNIELQDLKGLVLDLNKFIEINDIKLDHGFSKVKDFVHKNFIGFATKHGSKIILRNITDEGFQHIKLHIFNSPFLDYYQLNGNNPKGNMIILAEGIYDIYTEWLFDNLDLKKSSILYATALSDSYNLLLKSIVIDEQIFRPDVVILSDNGIDLNFYKNFKKHNCHMINSLTVYYNKNGKDFNDTPIIPVKYIL